MKVTVGVKVGKHKQICDDTVVVDGKVINDEFFAEEMDGFRVIGVADGVGGNAGGKDASLFVMNRLSDLEFPHDAQMIREHIIDINRRLLEFAASTPDRKHMATTLSAIVSVNGDYYIAHVGNTRVYVGQGSYLKQYTRDHTTYQWLLARGQFEAADACNKNEINACLGGDSESLVQQLKVEEAFDDIPACVVLTSDGIHEYIEIDRLEELVFMSKSDMEIVSHIIREAENNGSEDDKSIIIIRNK